MAHPQQHGSGSKPPFGTVLARVVSVMSCLTMCQQAGAAFATPIPGPSLSGPALLASLDRTWFRSMVLTQAVRVAHPTV